MLTAKQARSLLSVVDKHGAVAIKIPATTVDATKKAITLAKTRSNLSGRLSYHQAPEDTDGMTILSVTILKKPLPFEVVEIL